MDRETLDGFAAATGRLRSASRAWKNRENRGPARINVARCRMNRQGEGDVGVAAAQIRGLIERRQRGVKARDEDVDAPTTRRLRPTGRAGKIRGHCLSGHIHATRGRMDRERVAIVDVATAQV